MTNVAEFRDLPVVELKGRESELRRELFDLRMKMASDAGALKAYKVAKKDLARVLTILSEKAATEGATK